MEDERLEKALSELYARDLEDFGRTQFSRTVAILCDEYLDKSGEMLGRVRAEAEKIKRFAQIRDCKRHIAQLEEEIDNLAQGITREDIMEYMMTP